MSSIAFGLNATYESRIARFQKFLFQSVVRYCVRGTRTQPLISVGCFVHYCMSCAIKKEGFLRLHLFRHKFAYVCLTVAR